MTNEERIKADAEAAVKIKDWGESLQIEMYIAGATAEAERAQGLADALEELIVLKRMKDELGKTTNYLTRQPAAWKRAIEALQQFKDGKEVEGEI